MVQKWTSESVCRKCIYAKVVDEKVKFCPICNKELGPNPVEQLRPDRNRQNIRKSIFPFTLKKRVKDPEAESESLSNLPAKEREISSPSLAVDTPQEATPEGLTERLTSLVVDTPQEATPEGLTERLTSLVVDTPQEATPKALTGRRTSLAVDNPQEAAPKVLTGRRSKSVPRRVTALHGLGPIINDSGKKRHETLHKAAENIYSSGNSKKVLTYRRQTSSNAEMSNDIPDKDKDEPIQVNTGQVAAGTDGLVNSSKIRTKEDSNRSKVREEDIENSKSPSLKGKAKKPPGRKRRDPAAATPMQLEGANIQQHRQIYPIWFSLVTSHDKSGYPPLPQIPTSYLRIKDGNIPVSFIGKYLEKKLDLASETEVEIICRGQLVDPTMSVQSLVEKWIREETSRKVQATVGDSAEEFVMALTYRRAVIPE